MLPEEIIARLEAAGRALLSLPPEWLARQAASYGTAADLVSLRRAAGELARVGPGVVPEPSPRALDAMHEAFGWLSYIDARLPVRRIVTARALVHPITGRHLFSWRKLGGRFGADHAAVQRIHQTGIRTIGERLRA